MTLKEWCVKNGLTHTHPTTEHGAVSLCVPVDHPDRNALNNLTDFKNDSGANFKGVVFWFLPKVETNE